MKLIAVQRISDQLQPGASFEIPDHDVASAHTLIEAGLARKDEGESSPPAQAVEPEPPKDSSAPGRRTYRRRDLTAEEP